MVENYPMLRAADRMLEFFGGVNRMIRGYAPRNTALQTAAFYVVAAKYPDACPLQDLVKQLGYTRSTIGRSVAKMTQSAGGELVEYTYSKDRRAKVVCLTQRGIELFRALRDAYDTEMKKGR
jgi:DNA-binding MarR family transcriptional regulator